MLAGDVIVEKVRFGQVTEEDAGCGPDDGVDENEEGDELEGGEGDRG